MSAVADEAKREKRRTTAALPASGEAFFAYVAHAAVSPEYVTKIPTVEKSHTERLLKRLMKIVPQTLTPRLKIWRPPFKPCCWVTPVMPMEVRMGRR
jgi:hypothetical protein